MVLAKHACMLPQPLGYPEKLHPNAGFWQRFKYSTPYFNTSVTVVPTGAFLAYLGRYIMDLVNGSTENDRTCGLGWSRWRCLVLPCDWHYGTVVFIRSRKALQLERQRQLAAGHWFILHPYSPGKFYFDCLLWAITMAVGFYLPTQVFLNCPNPRNPYILAADFFAFCDIIIHFCSGYHDQNIKEIILDPKKIALNYLKGRFIFDTISAVPWQLYEPFDDCRYPSHTVFFILKAFRYLTLREKGEEMMEQFDASYLCTVIWRVSVRLSLFFNWMTYLEYQLPAICVHYYDLNNLGEAEAHWLKRLSVDPEVSPFKKYIANLYHVTAECVGSGYAMPVRNHVIPEMAQICFSSLVGLLFLIFCFVTVLRLVLCFQSNFIYDGALKELERYMKIKRLPKSLQNKIRLFINYKFGGRYMDENNILNTIQGQIKQDINMHTCRRLVVTVPMFKGFPTTLMNSIIFRLKQEIYVPEQEVITLGQLNGNMYFIYYGTVSVMDSHGREEKRLSDGAFFGQAGLLQPDIPATSTITALEITEIYALSNEDFQACIQLYSLIQKNLMENHQSFMSRTLPRQP